MKKTSSKPAKIGRPARSDKPQKINLTLSLAAKRRASALAKSQGTSVSALFDRLISAAPDEPEVTCALRLPLSVLKQAERAARVIGQTLNDYIVGGILADEDFGPGGILDDSPEGRASLAKYEADIIQDDEQINQKHRREKAITSMIEENLTSRSAGRAALAAELSRAMQA